MKNLTKLLGIIALAAVIGFGVAGCEQPTDTDTSTPVPVTSVTLDKATLELTVGGSAVLTATVAPADATDKAVTWDSDTTGVATVANGTVTAVSTGTVKITVTTNDGGKTAECTVTVKPVPASIAITKQPDKIKYGIGDTLDITGLEVTATYSDNTTEKVTVTAENITGFNSATAGSKTLTVTYGGKTATFTVTIVEVSSIAITKQPDKTTYNIGETLDITGLVVTATYSDNTTGTATVTVANITGFNSATAGAKTLTVTYSGKIATFTVTIVDITTPTEGLAYELITEGTNANTYRVRKGSVTEGAVVIPATYNSLPVTEIGNVTRAWRVENFAFYETSITSVAIPASVTSIGSWAFSGCTNLVSVTFAEGSQLETISYSAFADCTSITEITFPASVTSIGETAFYGCTGLTSITIPASVTEIEYGTFYDWTNSQTIYVEGFPDQATADAAWGANWRNNCNANIVYGIVSEIEITQQPSKTEYLIGEQLDITGLVVTAHFNDNSTATLPITAANITGFDSVTAGTKTLTITTGGKTTTFTVTVMEISSIAVTRQPNKMVYIIGEQLDITGIVVTANGTTATVPVTAADITGFDSSTLGTKTLTVIYNGKTAIFTVSVVDPLVVTNTQEWNTACTTLNGQTGNYVINIGGSFNVVGSTANTFGTTADGSTLTVRLIGNGTLSLSGNGNILRVGANQTIIIDSESLILKGLLPANNSSLIYVDGSSAKLELKNGTISGNCILRRTNYSVDASVYGGGVYVSASGTFIMSGGTISGNTAESSSDQGASASSYGGGVYNAGTFTMTGGTISGNGTSATGGYSYSYGGGVYNAGTFRIVNGTIYGSSAYPSSLSNTLYSSAINTSRASGAALYSSGTAQRGTFSGETWVSSGNISTTDYTINVVNGALQ